MKIKQLKWEKREIKQETSSLSCEYTTEIGDYYTYGINGWIYHIENQEDSYYILRHVFNLGDDPYYWQIYELYEGSDLKKAKQTAQQHFENEIKQYLEDYVDEI